MNIENFFATFHYLLPLAGLGLDIIGAFTTAHPRQGVLGVPEGAATCPDYDVGTTSWQDWLETEYTEG